VHRDRSLNGKNSTAHLLLFCLMFGCISPLHAAANEVEQKGVGYGDTYQQALSSALLESVRQVRGLEAGTTQGLRLDLNAISTNSTFHLDGKLEQTVDIYTQSKGWIKSYTLVDVKRPRNEGDSWQVIINATVPVYKQAVPDDQRQTVAVLPFRVDQAPFSVDNAPQSRWKIATQLASAIQSTLVLSQHYAVLNRNFTGELNREQQLWGSGGVNPVEASRLGEQLGADFMLLGHIDRFTLGHKAETFYDTDLGEQKAEIELSYQLIESATGKLIWSDQKRLYKPVKKNRNLFRQDEPHPLGDLISNLGNEIATDMLKATAPASALENLSGAATSSEQEQMPVPERPLTPGSSDKPWKW